jgi:hypothetical protein
MSEPTQVIIDNGPAMPGTFGISREMLDVSSATDNWLPDPTWECVDVNGHWHAFTADGKLPTLGEHARHVDCDGLHLFGEPDDEYCEGYTVVDYRCRICLDLVEPRRVPDGTAGQRHFVPGRTSWWVEVVTPQQIEGEHTVRVVGTGRVLFGVAVARMVVAEGDHAGVRVTTRFDGIGELGERKVSAPPED